MNATTNQTMGRRLLIMAGTICLASAVFVPTGRAEITGLADRRDHLGQRRITPGPGVNLSGWNSDDPRRFCNPADRPTCMRSLDL